MVRTLRRKHLLEKLEELQRERYIKREAVFKLQARKDTMENKVDIAIENVSTKEEDDLKMHEFLDNLAAFDVSIDSTFDPIVERYQNDIKDLEKEISRIREKLIRLSTYRDQ